MPDHCAHEPDVRRSDAPHKSWQLIYVDIKDIRNRLTNKVFGGNIVEVHPACDDTKASMRHSRNETISIDRNCSIRIDIEKIWQFRQSQYPVLVRSGHQIGKLDTPRGRSDQMKCELLACLCSRRAQLRDIKNCRQVTKSVKIGAAVQVRPMWHASKWSSW